LGLGSAKWSVVGTSRYAEIVQTALANGISTIETGQEGGDAVLADIYRNKHTLYGTKQPLEILFKVGYRIVPVHDGSAKKIFEGSLEGELASELPPIEDEDPSTGSPLFEKFDVFQNFTETEHQKVVHNINPDFLKSCIESSPLFQLATDFPDQIQLVVLLHNPEVQVLQSDAISSQLEQRQNILHSKLIESFTVLHQFDILKGYGVSSNGLCLPSHHPLFLDFQTVMRSFEAVDSRRATPKSHIIQLPANVLERNGIYVAKKIQQNQNLTPIKVYAMRPLTCYPDAGTGTGKPFALVDYQVPAGLEQTWSWTNTMTHPPLVYEAALKSALSHLDAEDLIAKQSAGMEPLSVEERETIDGCKLLRSILHDLDVNLERTRSLAAHQESLAKDVIPIIQGHFEGMDDETLHVLQTFFGAYNLAVRYAVARNTRRLLRHGEQVANEDSGDNASTSPQTIPEDELPDSKRLQEFGLEFLLKATGNETEDGLKPQRPAFDKIILGASQPEQVLDAIEIVRKHDVFAQV
jgi:hypothetical protein